MNLERPNIFTYQDPIGYISDLISFLKPTKNQFNLNMLAKKSGLAVSNISMMLNKQRPLTEKSFHKLVPFLYLSKDEKAYLNHLRIICHSEEQTVRMESLNQIIRMSKSNKFALIMQIIKNWRKNIRLLNNFILNAF